jgi:EAL domain-containing protein (putative c-di-GMP-specific phosphodiesterase class I)
VETDGQYHFLRQHGAHIIQGYLFSPPVPAGDLAPMLSPGYFREKISQIGAG